jgi:RHS repeat-associated protein
MVVNGQTPVGYQYDANSRLTQVAQGDQIVGLGYDAAGRRTTLTYPNGTFTNYTYDPASRLTRILHESATTVIEDLNYTYDTAGNRISFKRNRPQAPLPEPIQAAYDAANQQIQFNSSTPHLNYDANGNLISQTDANGTTTYTWDARNRLIGISGPAVSASFVYDALGRRISKTVNGVRTDYQYDGNDIVAEIGGGAVATTYLRSLNIDEPFARQSNTIEYYHADALGSVLALTDQTGVVQTTYRYEPFGRTAVTGASANPFQYTGRENDGTGLYYYRARYYYPTMQRFISEDPYLHPTYNMCSLDGSTSGRRTLSKLAARNSEGLNVYSYVVNSPLLFTDPTGLDRDGGCVADCALRCTARRIPARAEEVGICTVVSVGGCAAYCVAAGPGYAACVSACATTYATRCVGAGAVSVGIDAINCLDSCAPLTGGGPCDDDDGDGGSSGDSIGGRK